MIKITKMYKAIIYI